MELRPRRTPPLPANYVTLRQLQERHLQKIKLQEEEEELERKLREEEKAKKQEEEERLQMERKHRQEEQAKNREEEGRLRREQQRQQQEAKLRDATQHQKKEEGAKLTQRRNPDWRRPVTWKNNSTDEATVAMVAIAVPDPAGKGEGVVAEPLGSPAIRTRARHGRVKNRDKVRGGEAVVENAPVPEEKRGAETLTLESGAVPRGAGGRKQSSGRSDHRPAAEVEVVQVDGGGATAVAQASGVGGEKAEERRGRSGRRWGRGGGVAVGQRQGGAWKRGAAEKGMVWVRKA